MLSICKSITYRGGVDNKAQDVVLETHKGSVFQQNPALQEADGDPHTGLLAASAGCHTEGRRSFCLSFFSLYSFSLGVGRRVVGKSEGFS